MSKIYLDNAATTFIDPAAAQAMREYLEARLGNASSIHAQGVKAARKIEMARQALAIAIGSAPEEVYFTSGGTESNNWALKGVCWANRGRGDHVIVSQIEHPSILDTAAWLEQNGFRVTYLGVDSEGKVDPGALQKAIGPRTILVSIMHANNEVGTVQDLAALGAICRKAGVLFHSDATQSFTKVSIDVVAQNVDLLTFSAHKAHGPRGVACLYVKAGTMIEPLLHGGGQETGMRSGTYNGEGIVGFAAAVAAASDLDIRKMSELRDHVIAEIERRIPDARLNGARRDRLANNIHFSFTKVDGKKVLFALDKKGFSVSVGSACSSGKKVASHVLTAMGRTTVEASASVRISLSKWTTRDEIEAFLASLQEIIEVERSLFVAAQAG